MTLTNLERAVIPFISKHLNKRLNSAETEFIRHKLKNATNIKSVPALTKSIIKQLVYVQRNTSSTVPKNLDDFHVFHQMDARESDNPEYDLSGYSTQLTVEVTKFLNYDNTTLFELSHAMNPASKEVYSYIMFDTDNKNVALSSEGHYHWLLNDGVPNYINGTINLYHKLNPIKYMRIARTIFGNLHPVEYLKLTESAGNRFALTIEGLESQSMILNNGLTFHFIQYLLPARLASNPSLSSYRSNRGWFHFADPHNNVDRLGISIVDMATPASPIIVHDTPAVITAVQLLGFNVASPYGNIQDPLFIAANLIDSLGLYYASIRPTGIPDTAGGATSSLPFIFGGWDAVVPGNPVQAALIAAYNSSVQPLVKNHDGFFQPPVPIAASDRPVGLYPVTITFQNNPRMTTVLELISDIPSGEKIT